MLTSTILPRAPRSTRTTLAAAERQQNEIITHLRAIGEESISNRLERCQQARRTRQPGQWPWRCGSVGCWACRRSTVRRWWRGFTQWLSGPDLSLVIIPIPPGDLIVEARRLRKGLRDIRDRAAQIDPAWTAVAVTGTIADNHLMLLVKHDGIEREVVWNVLERRWPEVVVSAVGTVEPCSEWSIETTVQLAIQRRGIEPIRIVIPAQRRTHEPDEVWDEPMPMLV